MISINQKAKEALQALIDEAEENGGLAKFENGKTAESVDLSIGPEMPGLRSIWLGHYTSWCGGYLAHPEFRFYEMEGNFYPCYYCKDAYEIEQNSIGFDCHGKVECKNEALQVAHTELANKFLEEIESHHLLSHSEAKTIKADIQKYESWFGLGEATKKHGFA